jgi:hypothetical protein
MAHVSVPQHTASVDALVAEVASLASLEEAQSWNTRAKAGLDKITADLGIIERKLPSLQQEVIRLQANHDAKPAYLKLKGKGSEYKSAAEQLAQFQIGHEQLVELADKLQVAIDKVPNSPDEQKLLARELQLQKKELLLEKKKVTSQMSAIRVESRQILAQLTNIGWRMLRQSSSYRGRSYYQLINSEPYWQCSLGRAVFPQHEAIRGCRDGEQRHREAELAPHEARKAAIEEEIMWLERQILWAEKLK